MEYQHYSLEYPDAVKYHSISQQRVHGHLQLYMHVRYFRP